MVTKRYRDGTHPRIVIVGAGFSGLCAAIQLQEQLDIHDYRIYEMNADLGGVWHVNTYPGCAVDVPAHLFSFSFAQNPEWSQVYAERAEIWQYMRRVADQYGVYDRIRFSTQVVATDWSSDRQCWIVRTQSRSARDGAVHEDVFEADVVVRATGPLRVPSKPAMFGSFQAGPTIHSAEWDHSVDLRGKHVAIVGSGASAVQIIPQLAPLVGQLTVFHRTPSYVIPRNSYRYSSIIKTLFRYVPVTQWLYRCFLFLFLEVAHRAFFNGSLLSRVAPQLAALHRYRQISDEKLRAKVTPRYAMGCKRITVSDDYYPALARPNVVVETAHIATVSADAITTASGATYRPDVLVLATGFKLREFGDSVTAITRRGDELGATIRRNTRSYYGTCFENTPNTFNLLGPNSGLGHNTIIFVIECQVAFMVETLSLMMQHGIAAMEITPAAVDRFQAANASGLDGSVWQSDCMSWYQHPETGTVDTLYSGTCIQFWLETRKPTLELFDIVARR
ncbi:flavin-containing monooxygenase FMO [Ramicandelaber brevisporus]|nr:flavin-containing monooxygenase FMO [Ramicandelaber brevisporus]